MRILIAFGTRPEIIKMGPVYQALKRRRGVELEVFWTGQHKELADGLTDLFGIAVTHNGSGLMDEPGLAGKLGGMTREIDFVLRRKKYDWLVVQGDTITASAAASAGFLNRVPVAHVEAGLRTGNMFSPWPEEYNRRIITLCANAHFAPTRESEQNLLSEGVRADQIHRVGNTIVDALLYTRERVRIDYVPRDPAVLRIPADKKLVLATMHRRENIGENMVNVLKALRVLAGDGDKAIVLPIHLNPQVKATVEEILDGCENVHLLASLQYPDFVHLLSRAWTVVTDSGGVQEEAPTFGLQILITRDTTERPEVLSSGFGRLVGSDPVAITEGVRALTHDDRPQLLPAANPFGDGAASERIAAIIADQRRGVLAAPEQAEEGTAYVRTQG